jgi:hypothetical protein
VFSPTKKIVGNPVKIMANAMFENTGNVVGENTNNGEKK